MRIVDDGTWRQASAPTEVPSIDPRNSLAPERVLWRDAHGDLRNSELVRVEADGTHVVRISRFETRAVAAADIGGRTDEEAETLEAEAAERLSGRYDLRVEAQNATGARLRFNPARGIPDTTEVATALGVTAADVTSLEVSTRGRMSATIAQVVSPASVQVGQVTKALVAGLNANDPVAQQLARELVATYFTVEPRVTQNPTAQFSIAEYVTGAIPTIAKQGGRLWERVSDYAVRLAPDGAKIKLDRVSPTAPTPTMPAVPAGPTGPTPMGAPAPAPAPTAPAALPATIDDLAGLKAKLASWRQAAMSVHFEIVDRYQQGPLVVLVGKFPKSEAKDVSDAQLAVWWRQTVEQELQKLNGPVWSLQRGAITVEVDRAAGHCVGKTTVGERTGLPLKDERERVYERGPN